MPSEVSAYLAAVNEWTACIDTAVHEFAASRTGTSFDPFAACPSKPEPGTFSVGNRPAHAGRPEDPGSQGNGRPDDPGEQGQDR